MNTIRHHQGEPARRSPQLASIDPLPAPAPPPPGSQFDPGGVLSAVMLYPLTVVICAILLCGAGVFVGATRAPTYTASSELLVGNLSISDPSALPGAVGAARALAAVYARLLDANEVQEDVAAKAAGDEPLTRLSATPIVESPLIRVTAESKSEQTALRAANAAGASLSAYVNDLRSPGGQTAQIVKEYRQAQLRLSEKLEAFEALQARFGPDPSVAERDLLNEAQADLEAARLRRTSIAGLYSRGANIRLSQPNLDVYERATAASNDRGSTMQFTGAIGLAAGLLLGAALATFRANRWARRGS
jgi:uncharacterized protein involved in exopolysaccharide biosynthesis